MNLKGSNWQLFSIEINKKSSTDLGSNWFRLNLKTQRFRLSHNQNRSVLNDIPVSRQRIKKGAAPIYGWDCPLLTFIYPGFDCSSTDRWFRRN